MITRGKVLNKADEYGYKWNVSIPLLYGLPSKIKSNEGEKNEGTVVTNQTRDVNVVASVCGFPNALNLISSGDIVMIGFEDNDISNPIILGHLLTKSICEKSKTKPSLVLQDLYINNSVELPINTQIHTKNPLGEEVVISMSDILQVIEFFKHKGGLGNI